MLGVLACGALACTFDGYVPKEHVPAPKASDRVVPNLQIGEVHAAAIECGTSNCRERYRILVPRAGVLHVAVDGPTADGPGEPRIVQLALENPGQAVLGVTYGENDDPFELDVRVGEGLHFVLVQAFGGHIEYKIRVELDAAGTATAAGTSATTTATATATAATTATTTADAPDAPPSGWPSGEAAAAGGDPHRLGDTSDGADFAYDPSAQIGRYRSYAFAQNPAEDLRGTPGSVKGNPFVERQVQREVRYYLDEIGINQVAIEEAEMLVSIQVGAQSTTWYSVNSSVYNQSYDLYFDQWRSMGIHLNTHTYVDGTLMIDFINPESGHLVWHGWTTEPIPTGEVDSAKIIKDAVRAVLSQYGPG